MCSATRGRTYKACPVELWWLWEELTDRDNSAALYPGAFPENTPIHVPGKVSADFSCLH